MMTSPAPNRADPPRFEHLIGREEFRKLPHAVTFLGMSGVGKTRLASQLRRTHRWFHYSADYRIGTQYLARPIIDAIKERIIAAGDNVLTDLLKSDSIYVAHNITIDNLDAVSSYLGMFGDPSWDDPNRRGLPKAEFLRRQRQYRDAERAAMVEMSDFLDSAWRIFRYWNFVNDASGSLCEIVDADDPEEPLFGRLAENSMILYLEGSEALTEELVKRARLSPKPLYYAADFLGPRLAGQPDDGVGVDTFAFAGDLIEPLIRARRPKYEKLARRFGFTVSAERLPQMHEAAQDDDGTVVRIDEVSPDTFERRFVDLLYDVLAEGTARSAAGAARAGDYVARCRGRGTLRTVT